MVGVANSEEYQIYKHKDYPSQLVLMIRNIIAESICKRLVSKEGPGHLIDFVICSKVPEELYIFPEVIAPERPVGHSYRLPVRI